MGYGYQERDYDVIDYELYELEGIGWPLRGPRPARIDPGRYIAFIGAAQTFGCFVPEPFPALVGDRLGRPVVNMGVAGAGPVFFATKPRYLELINQAAFAVVQVMSGRSESNRVFLSTGGEMLERRADGVKLGAQPAYAELMKTHDLAFVRDVVEETRRNWLANFRMLLTSITVPKVLLWFSTRQPNYVERFDHVDMLFGAFPHMVNQEMVTSLRPLADAYVEAVTSRGLPQPLINRFTGQPTSVETRPDLGTQPTTQNTYYPSPEMNRDAADALEPVCRTLIQSIGQADGVERSRS